MVAQPTPSCLNPPGFSRAPTLHVVILSAGYGAAAAGGCAAAGCLRGCGAAGAARRWVAGGTRHMRLCGQGHKHTGVSPTIPPQTHAHAHHRPLDPFLALAEAARVQGRDALAARPAE